MPPFEQLRRAHPVLHYQGFSTELRNEVLSVEYQFLLEPDIAFRPTLQLPLSEPVDPEEIAPYLFQIGMVELISYWKCACPPKVAIQAAALTPDQAAWWQDLFIHGLGEFFYNNNIDPTAGELIELRSEGPVLSNPSLPHTTSGGLLMVAGGKDSTVSLELLRELPEPLQPFLLNPSRSALTSLETSNAAPPLIAKRTIDPKLLELNAAGYLNGHTPFSAYLAFCAVCAAALHKRRYVIASNERSSDEANLHFHGLAVNHQYSKSFRFEKKFRSFVKDNLSEKIEYFSFLRPLYDVQIAALFSQLPQHFSSFRSCNVGQRENRWCRQCPKCAFVALSLAPFLPEKQLQQIFGADPFAEPALQQHIRALTGLIDHKPFECVGTEEESRAAVLLTVQQETQDSPFLREIAEACQKKQRSDSNSDACSPFQLGSFSQEHCLPEAFCRILQSALLELQDVNH